MKDRFKRLVLSLLGVAILASGQVSAQYCGGGRGGCSFDGCFEVGGEALYWKPTGADFQYAITTTGSAVTLQTRETRTVVGDYDWGLRIFGSYFSSDCCNFVTLDWTYLRTSDADRTRGAFDSFDIVGAPSLVGVSATGRLRFDYDKVNVRLGRYICCGCDSRLYAYAGGRYIDIEERRTTRGLATGDIIVQFDEKTSFEGGGFEAGLGGEYDLWCDVGLVANVGLTAAVGDMKSRQKTATTGGGTDIREIGSSTICVPGAELRIGVDYTYRGNCWWITGEVGYQMDYYWRALGLHGQYGDGTVFVNRTSVGFAGLYFGLSVRF